MQTISSDGAIQNLLAFNKANKLTGPYENNSPHMQVTGNSVGTKGQIVSSNVWEAKVIRIPLLKLFYRKITCSYTDDW